MSQSADPQLPARERRFYLEQFSGRTLVVAVDGGTPADHAAVDTCVSDLAAEGVHVVVVVAGGRIRHWQPDDAGVVSVWRQLRRHGRMKITLPQEAGILRSGMLLAGRLRAFKLVLLSDGVQRPGSAGRAPSFATLDSATLEGDTIEQLDQVQGLVAQALRGGVATVNVCHPADLATELLTYAGAGTCYTLHDYCQVQRLGIDDYPQVAELIQRGVEEGYLKPRDPDAIARLIVNGYGARVGDHHVAGFVALLTEPYSPERLGELCALTTISRFAGEGIGEQLVQTMLQDAAATGLDGVFACTTAEPAARFFRRLGFVEVPQDQLPAAKWKDYDPVRRGDLRAFMHLLALI